jgi:hypothetical protein
MNLKGCKEMRVNFSQGIFAKQPVDNKEEQGGTGGSSSHALNLNSLSLKRGIAQYIECLANSAHNKHTIALQLKTRHLVSDVVGFLFDYWS